MFSIKQCHGFICRCPGPLFEVGSDPWDLCGLRWPKAGFCLESFNLHMPTDQCSKLYASQTTNVPLNYTGLSYWLIILHPRLFTPGFLHVHNGEVNWKFASTGLCKSIHCTVVLFRIQREYSGSATSAKMSHISFWCDQFWTTCKKMILSWDT